MRWDLLTIAFLFGANLILWGPALVHVWRKRSEPLSARWLWLILAVVLTAALVDS